MKIWSMDYHPHEFITLVTDGGELYLDGTKGETQPVSKVKEAESKRSLPSAPPSPLSPFPKYNVPSEVPVIKLDRSKPNKYVPCPICLREGRDLDVAMGFPNKCSFCAEVGKVIVCGKCGGMFKCTAGSCGVCHGEGLWECPDCFGFGEITVGIICKRCKGAGHLTRSGKALK